MCMACVQEDMLFRDWLLDRPEERDKLTEEEARYYGFKRDPLTGKWVNALNDAFRAEAVEPADAAKPAGQ